MNCCSEIAPTATQLGISRTRLLSNVTKLGQIIPLLLLSLISIQLGLNTYLITIVSTFLTCAVASAILIERCVIRGLMVFFLHVRAQR